MFHVEHPSLFKWGSDGRGMGMFHVEHLLRTEIVSHHGDLYVPRGT